MTSMPIPLNEENLGLLSGEVTVPCYRSKLTPGILHVRGRELSSRAYGRLLRSAVSLGRGSEVGDRRCWRSPSRQHHARQTSVAGLADFCHRARPVALSARVVSSMIDFDRLAEGWDSNPRRAAPMGFSRRLPGAAKPRSEREHLRQDGAAVVIRW